MNFKKVVLNNWIADRGDPRRTTELRPMWDTPFEVGAENSDEANRAVREAIDRLTDDEKEIVVRYYLMGESLSEIGSRSGRRPSSLHSLLRRALLKVRRRLAPFVATKFNLKAPVGCECCLCNSPDRLEIDRLIRERDRTRPWKPIISVLKEKYGLRISTPQILIGHERYHM